MAWYDFIKGFFGKNPPEKNEDVEELLEMLKSMTEDLTFTSESDYPFETIAWQKITKRLNAEALPTYLSEEEKDEKIEVLKVEKLLRNQAKTRRSFTDEQLKKANQFKQIIQFFQSQVSYPSAFKVGTTERTVYLLGIVASDYIIGLKTISIET